MVEKNEAACNRPTARKGDVPTIVRLTQLVPSVSELLKAKKNSGKEEMIHGISWGDSWHFMGKVLSCRCCFCLFVSFSCCASVTDVEAEHERCCMILGICERGAMAMVSFICIYIYMGVSENSGTPKSSILIGFSIINHQFLGTTVYGNPHIIYIYIYVV